jgi:hypothetical protein
VTRLDNKEKTMSNTTPAGTYKYETLAANGCVCCGANDAANFSRCENCKDKPLRTASLRTAIPAHPYAPPDPYSEPLKAMRRDLPVPPVVGKSPCPYDDKNYQPGNGSVPDPYAAGIAKMRKENK